MCGNNPLYNPKVLTIPLCNSLVCGQVYGKYTIQVMQTKGCQRFCALTLSRGVMRLVVWGRLGGYERCMPSWCMREYCLFLTVETLPLFKCWQNVLLDCVWCWSLCTVTLCTVVERWVVCYCIVSDIGGTPMMICTYHYRMERLH